MKYFLEDENSEDTYSEVDNLAEAVSEANAILIQDLANNDFTRIIVITNNGMAIRRLFIAPPNIVEQVCT